MSRWFRFYDEAINDPKILRLSDAQFRAWVTLLCIASKNDGLLPSTNDIALVLRIKPPKVAEWLATLTGAGLLDNDNGLFSPHNWSERQYKSDSSAERMKRHRDKKRDPTSDVTGDVTVTVQNRADTETDTEQKKKTRVAALPLPWGDGSFDEFWRVFPNKVGKADAQKAFLKAVRKINPIDFFQALQRYANKTDDRPFCNPSTWLNQERWLDQPAANSNGRRTVHDAARDLHENILRQIDAFDQPAPSGLCDGEGENPVRLLPAR